MKQKIYEPQFGEMTFKIAINRNILADVMDKFSDHYADTIGLSTLFADIKNTESDNNMAIVERAFRNGKAKALLGNDEEEISIAKYALPKMLEAGEQISSNVAKTKADEIFAYAEQNNAVLHFSEAIGNVIMEGFTLLRVEEKPKITLKMG